MREADQTDQAQYLELHRTLLRRCRELGIGAAWTEFEAAIQAAEQQVKQQTDDSGMQYDADPEAVAAALDAFVNARSWDEKHAVLEREQALLLSLTANHLLFQHAMRARERGDERAEHELERHRGLLRQSRYLGVAAAWAEFDAARRAAEERAGQDETALDQPLLTWLNTADRREERRLLEAHRELLAPESDTLLSALLWSYYGQANREQRLRDALALLRDIRVREPSDDAIRDGYVNAFGGSTLELPAWLEEVVRQEEQLYNSGHLYETAAARVALLRQAIERAQRDGDVLDAAVAELRNRLTNALKEDPRTPRAAALEAALEAQQAALATYTLSRYPYQYAMTQGNLAIIYRNRIASTRRDNLEEAIACYREVLLVFALGDFPQRYAQTQMNLGVAYQERIAGNRRDNLEQAIACYREALRVRTVADFPQDYATTQNNLGITYGDRIAGNRRDNLEESIARYRAALRIYTLADFPIDFRDTQVNLAGLAFDDLAAEAEDAGNAADRDAAYRLAHEAYAQARQAQAELSWLESDEAGKAKLQGDWHGLREMYVRDAWCLTRLGLLHEAVMTLEAGRAQALAESNAIAGATLEGVCDAHREQFIAARRRLQRARALGERTAMRQARDAFLDARQAIRAHCQADFLPSEFEYASIAEAAKNEQALVYVAVTDKGGFALVVPPAHQHESADTRIPVAIALPRITWQLVDDWLVRRDSERRWAGAAAAGRVVATRRGQGRAGKALGAAAARGGHSHLRGLWHAASRGGARGTCLARRG